MWPQGTAQWCRTRILIVSADRDRRNRLLQSWSDADVVVAATPIEVIRWLELEGPAISTVVLSDVVGSATCEELAEFLEQRYPFVRVIASAAADANSPEYAPRLRATDSGDRSLSSS